MSTDIYMIRPYNPAGDKSFVMATFLRGLYYGESWFSLIPKDIFMSNYKHILEQLLAKSFIHIACLKDDADVILGYSIMSDDFTGLHWVFVKSAWRQQKIASHLVPPTIQYVTHLSDLGKVLLKKHKTIVFNPFQV